MHRDAALFLWTTDPMLRHALDVIEAWGFTYKTVAFYWVKLNKSRGGMFLSPKRLLHRHGLLDPRQSRAVPARHRAASPSGAPPTSPSC